MTRYTFIYISRSVPKKSKEAKIRKSQARKKYTIGKGSNISTFSFVVLPALFGENLGLP